VDLKDFKVEVSTIDEIIPHPNADMLNIFKVKGWQVVARTNTYNLGDTILYIPVDSILPEKLEKALFPEDSKIKLNNSRIKAIKIRQFVSQGMIIDLDTICQVYSLSKTDFKLGSDVGSLLNITKYEPPVPKFQMGSIGPANKNKANSNFHVYTKFPRLQNYPLMFKEEDDVVVTEKIHGTNFRAGWVPFEANKWWRKLLKFVGLAPQWQFVYGTHYTQLSDKFLYKGYYEQNVYAKMVSKYKLKNILKKGDVIYGEIYGAGIQKGYTYGLNNDIDLVVFDIMRNGKYLDYEDFEEQAFYGYYLKIPALLFEGKYKDCNLNDLCVGESILSPTQKVREGCMVKPLIESDLLPRKGAKVINPAYLLEDNTEFH